MSNSSLLLNFQVKGSMIVIVKKQQEIIGTEIIDQLKQQPEGLEN